MCPGKESPPPPRGRNGREPAMAPASRRREMTMKIYETVLQVTVAMAIGAGYFVSLYGFAYGA